ncbi:MAG: sigma-70 family RNA polymerase sigma factor [Planctomycetota bacterium]|jgi:RNA polymerase sigma-70 factor (ECF subfamily)
MSIAMSRSQIKPAPGSPAKADLARSAAEVSSDPETWLEDHGDALYAYAVKRVRTADVAEELVQETLLAAITSYEAFEGRSTLRTWLTGILRNKILQHHRTASRSRETRFSELAEQGVEGQFTDRGKWRKGPGRWGGRPDRMQEDEEFLGVLERCLSKLPPRIAEAFLLVEQQQLTTDDVKSVLGATAANIHVMLYRARSGLRQCLERNWFGGSAGSTDGRAC